MFRKLAEYGALVTCFMYLAGRHLNKLVIAANDGLFPVIAPECKTQEFWGQQIDFRHICDGPETHLRWFADWIHFDHAYWSPGDFLLMVSNDYLIYFAVFALIAHVCVKLSNKFSPVHL